jgi:hypothetical protein
MLRDLPETVWTLGIPLIMLAILWVAGAHAVVNFFAMVFWIAAAYVAFTKWAAPEMLPGSEGLSDALYFIMIVGAILLSTESLAFVIFRVDVLALLMGFFK